MTNTTSTVNKNRRTLVWMLLLVWLALPYLGGFGPVEVILWLGLLSGWVWLLLVWSKRPSRPRREKTPEPREPVV